MVFSPTFFPIKRNKQCCIKAKSLLHMQMMKKKKVLEKRLKNMNSSFRWKKKIYPRRGKQKVLARPSSLG